MCVLSLKRRTSLNFRFQKELATNGNATVSTIRHNVVNTDAIVSDVRNDALNVPTIVSDSRLNALKSSENAHGKDLRVSTVRTLPVAE